MMDKNAYERFCKVHERALNRLRGIIVMSSMPSVDHKAAMARIDEFVNVIVDYEVLVEETSREDIRKAIWGRIAYLDRIQKSKPL